jgi:hypothetical protein
MRYLVTSICLIFCFALGWTQSKQDITIAAGNRSGIYYKFAETLKKVLEDADKGLNVIILETAGSEENIDLIIQGVADIAFMQSESADYLQTDNPVNRKDPPIYGLASLYNEVIHIVALKNFFLQSISDLEGESVALGEKNSGTLRNSLAILRANGLKEKDVDPYYLPLSDIKEAFSERKISAAFVTSGLKIPLFLDMAGSLNFISLDNSVLLELQKNFPHFISTLIPANTYQDQLEPINAAGIRALLVCRKEVEPQVAYLICQQLFGNRKTFIAAHPIARQINLRKATKGMTIDLHEGAVRFYQRQRKLNNLYSILIIIGLFIISFATRKHIHKFMQYLAKQLRKNIQFRIILIILILFILGTIGSFYFEHRINENFDTIYKAFWATIVYLLSGFEIEPLTTGGRLSAFLLLIGGMGILGTVVGNIATIFLKEGEEKMPKNTKRHIAICNWNKRGEKIIEELHHPSAEPETTILVLTETDVNEKELRDKSDRYANVYFIKGKPTVYKTLKDARIHLAKSVIVLSDSKEDEPDPKVILTCLAIRQLQKDASEQHVPHIISELMDRNNRQLALDAGADEIVSAGFYRTGIMLQSARYHNLSDIYHELLIYEDNTSSIYIIDSDNLPHALIGKTFLQAAEIFNQNRDEKNPVILIGVRRVVMIKDNCGKEIPKTHVILNPKNENSNNDVFSVFQEGDSLIVISHCYPDLSFIK